MKRILSLLLALLLCVSLLPAAALAEEEAAIGAESSEDVPAEVELPVLDVAAAEEEPAPEPEPAAEPEPVEEAEPAEEAADEEPVEGPADEEPVEEAAAEPAEEPADEPAEESVDEPEEEPALDGASGTCGDDLTWTLSGATLTISGTGAMWNYGGNDRPPWYDKRESVSTVVIGSGVTGIGTYAFRDFTALTSVTIPTGVTVIDQYSFADCTSLTSVAVPEGVTLLPFAVFSSCSSLSNVTLPESLMEIDRYVFAECSSLQSIEIPSNVKYIGNYAFRNCTDLAEITFRGSAPQFLFSAGEEANAFKNVTATVYYPAGDDSWTEGVRQNYGGTITWVASAPPSGQCGNNLTWTLVNGVLTISGSGAMTSFNASSAPWYGLRAGIRSVVLPDGLTSIGGHAFQNCTALTSVTIPDAVRSIEREAFIGCTALGSVTIPASVTSIQTRAFADCTSLSSITFLGAAPSFSTDNTFRGVTATAYYPGDDASWTEGVRLNYGGTITWVASSVIDSGSFGDGLSWTLTDDGTLTVTGSGPMPDFEQFRDAPWGQYSNWSSSQITRLVIGSGITTIGSNAFALLGVTEVTIPAGVTRIGAQAFINCRELRTVSIPESVRSIWSAAFCACYKLESIALPAGLTIINDSLFSGCSSLTSVTIPSSVFAIGNHAFSGTTSLKHITLPGGVGFINCGAFYSSGLTEITIPDSVYGLDEEAFAGCTNLRSVVIGSGLAEISDRSFSGCTNLSSVSIPASVTVIGAYAFENTRSLARITIPQSVKEIRTGAFAGTGLLAGESTYQGSESEWRRIQIYGGNDLLWAAVGYAPGASGFCGPNVTWTVSGSTLTISGSGETYNYTNPGYENISGPVPAPWAAYNDDITTVVVKSGVTSLGNSLFCGSKAASFSLPNTLTAIGWNTFQSCKNLKSIVLPNSVTEFGHYVFRYCSALVDVTLPSGVTTVQYGMFASCTSLPSVDIPASVTEIGHEAFMECTALDGVEIPDGVTWIGQRAFERCESLTSLVIPGSVTKIYEWAMRECRNLASVTLSSGLKTIEEAAFDGCESMTDVVIPDTVTKLGQGAFMHCHALQSVSLSNSVTALEYAVFKNCTSLASVTVPASVQVIAERAFHEDGALKSITFEGGAPIFGSDQSCLTFGNDEIFSGVTATAYYPAGASGWTADVMQDYGGTITWVPVGGVPLAITAQPASVTAAAGEKVTLHIAAESSGTIDYQWQYSKDGGVTWNDCSGAGFDTDTFSFTMKAKLDGRLYQCVVSDETSELTSDAAAITLFAVTGQPKSVTAAANDRVTLSVAAAGDGLQYQWEYSKDGGVTWKNCKNAGYNTASFSFTMTAGLDGRLYRCKVTHGGKTLTSDAAVITLFAITAQPEDVIAAAGETVTLHVAASGDGLTYQWQYKKVGGKWTDCKTGTCKTDTFSFTMTAGLDGRQYRCLVTGTTTLTSEAATITLFAITTQPEDVTAVPGETVTLYVAASGDGLTYQWQYKKVGGTWTNCTSGTCKTDTFSFAMKDTLNGRQYRCLVTGGTTLTSDAATITLFGITGQPKDVNAAAGTRAELTVKAVGDGLSYQWQLSRDGGETWNDCTSEGSDQASFSFKLKASFSGRQYRCVVTDESGHIATSAAATITVG